MSDLVERVVTCVNSVVKDVTADADSTIAGLSADDLDIMEIDLALEEEFGITLDDATFMSVQSVADMCSLVEELL